jgi:hypothetical protein
MVGRHKKMNKYEIQTLANTINEKLLSNKKYFDGGVFYQLQDGSEGFVNESFCMKKEDWYVVFSEHNLPLILYIDDVTLFFEIKLSPANPKVIDSKFIDKVDQEYAKYKKGEKKCRKK